VRLAAPAFLLALPAVAWFWWLGGRRGLGPRARVLRCAAAGLLVLAMAGIQIRTGVAPLSIVFALDLSESMGARASNALATLRAATREMRPADRAGLVVFGADAAVERRLAASGLENVAPVARTLGSATNIEAALRTARAALPVSGPRRIVLISDGRETLGRAVAEAAAAAADGVAIDVVTPRQTDRVRTADVTRVSAPQTVNAGEPFDVIATVEGRPGTAVDVTLEGATMPARQQLVLPSDGVGAVTFTERSTRQGLQVFRASVNVPDPIADFQGGGAGAVVAVAGEPRVLYVGRGRPDDLLRASAGYRVDVVAPQAVPRTAAALAEFDAALLDDVADLDLDAAQRRALAQYVEQGGGGLFVLGGPQSLVPPVTPDDALDAVLPIDLRPRRGTQSPGLALVVVFDKSGSMDDRIDGVPKIEFARQAVQRVLASVPPTDAVGVIAFDAEPVEVAPLQPGHSAADLTARLRAVRPAGSTAVGPAVERAAGWLRATPADAYARRLILLVSDGRTTAADEARAAAALGGPGIELSAVALGDEVDRRFLVALAQGANGRAFFPQNVRDLPAMVAREAMRVSGGRVVQQLFTPQASRHPILTGIDTSALPRLDGYVVSAARPDAAVVLSSNLGDPVLAAWRYGLGKVAVYTADLHSPWSARLRAWAGAGTLLSQTTRWLSRRVDHPFLDTQFAEENGQLRVSVDARTPDGGFLSLLDLSAVVRTPSGSTTTVTLAPVAPGLYEGRLPLADEGPYLLTISASDDTGVADTRVQRGFYWSAPRERQRGDANMGLLAALTEITGGRGLAAGENPFAGERPLAFQDISLWLAGGALLLFLVELLAPALAALVRPPAAARANPAKTGSALQKDAA
jgi:Ca-activated chloride channel family protein